MTRWLVLGAGGMLGQEMIQALHRDGRDYTGLTRAQCDITQRSNVLRAVRGHDVVVNCAAWTDVDAAEKADHFADLVNGYGAAHVADACLANNAKMIHISTDYVLSGTYGVPMSEDEPINPVNAYGHTKAYGEEWVRDILPETGYIVRTAWLYGEYGPNFVDTMARLAQGADPIHVVDDQWGQPTWARALAYRIISLGDGAASGTVPTGVYHGTSEGKTTWYGLARAVFEGLGHDPERVIPVTSEEYKRPAPRPTWSVLSHARWREAGLSPMLGNWKSMLGGAMATPWLSGPRI